MAISIDKAWVHYVTPSTCNVILSPMDSLGRMRHRRSALTLVPGVRYQWLLLASQESFRGRVRLTDVMVSSWSAPPYTWCSDSNQIRFLSHARCTQTIFFEARVFYCSQSWIGMQTMSLEHGSQVGPEISIWNRCRSSI